MSRPFRAGLRWSAGDLVFLALWLATAVVLVLYGTGAVL